LSRVNCHPVPSSQIHVEASYANSVPIPDTFHFHRSPIQTEFIFHKGSICAGSLASPSLESIRKVSRYLQSRIRRHNPTRPLYKGSSCAGTLASPTLKKYEYRIISLKKFLPYIKGFGLFYLISRGLEGGLLYYKSPISLCRGFLHNFRELLLYELRMVDFWGGNSPVLRENRLNRKIQLCFLQKIRVVSVRRST